MELENSLILAAVGLGSGLLAGLFGIGGGTILVPILLNLGCQPIQAVATSIFAIVMTAVSGTIQNWRMGNLNWQEVLWLGLPSLVTAQLGANVANILPNYALLFAFGCLLITNIFLSSWRKKLIKQKIFFQHSFNKQTNPNLLRVLTGASAGFLAGLFGIGGGVILVPLQMLFLNQEIKQAIQTSLAVIVITAISATFGHATRGNVLFLSGFILGVGGLIGAQISTRFLPKLPDRVVSFTFNLMLGILSVYIFHKAWSAYQIVNALYSLLSDYLLF